MRRVQALSKPQDFKDFTVIMFRTNLVDSALTLHRGTHVTSSAGENGALEAVGVRVGCALLVIEVRP